VVLEVQKFRHISEVVVLAKGLRLTAKEASTDMYAAFDKSHGSIQQQLARQHDRKKDHKGRRYKTAVE
jgi:ribosomal subunit interface protein